VTPHPRPRVGSLGIVPCVVVALLVACGGGDTAEQPRLSPLEERGLEVARTSGCVGCHGESGEGGAGPAWVGLAGSNVALSDGTVVVADTEYLHRSITTPSAQLVAGYTVVMPTIDLTDEEIDAVVAYIEGL
jgi:cytochrome c oxidase subunit 2